MTLLVDVSTDLHDVQEAHMRFRRQSEEDPNELSALQSGMPSMRKFVKPTDWEKIRNRATTFAEESLQNPSLAPKAVKKLALRMPEDPTKFVTGMPYGLWRIFASYLLCQYVSILCLKDC